MKKLSRMLLLVLLLQAFAGIPSHGAGIGVLLDRDAVPFTTETGYPFIDANGRTLVPFRLVLEYFGCRVEWNQADTTAIASKGDTRVEVPVGEAFIRVNGTVRANDSAAVIRDGRVYLPIRAVLEAFGATVSWDAAVQSVVVATVPESRTADILSTQGAALTEKDRFTVKTVIDGDTFRLSDGRLVRMIGIDSPEKEGPYTTQEYFGNEATHTLRALIEGQSVYLEKDVSEVDKYDRLLRYVYTAEGLNLNIRLAELGCARAVSYPPDTRYLSLMRSAETEAKKNRLGMWGQPD